MISRSFLVAAALAIAVESLNATAIPGLCPTGYAAYAGGCGVLLSPGTSANPVPDGNYTYAYSGIGYSGSGVPDLLTMYLTTADFGTPRSWYSDPGVSNWISIANSEYPNPGGASSLTVNYSINFNLTGFDLSTVSISGAWTADDLGLGLMINGTSLAGNSTNGSNGGSLPYQNDNGNPPDLPWSAIYSFTLNSSTANFTSHLLPGVNTLTFSVDQADDKYDALLVDALTGSGTLKANEVPAPEPGSILLVAAGLGIVALRRRRG